jgi:hypothetical protein
MTVPDDDRVPEEHLEPGERDPEAAPEDVAEQARLARPAENGDVEIHLGDDASEWDAVEQSRIVELEDEDYR